MTTNELLSAYQLASDEDRRTLHEELFKRLAFAADNRRDPNDYSPREHA